MESASEDASSRSCVTYRRELERVLQPRKLLSQRYPQFGIEARQRFVEKQDPRLTDQAACKRDTLLPPPDNS